jgi:superfamily II DNA or RNA helicase
MSMDDADSLELDDSDLLEPRQVLAALDRGFTDLPLLQPEHALDLPLNLSLHPRTYQREAVQRWLDAEGRGVVVLPTGAGKTVVAMIAMEAIGARTLIVVPTIELLEQWRVALVERLGLPADSVGVIGGGRRDLRPVTVITYQSAQISRRLRGAFGLIVFDEVHHLPAASYRRIPRLVGAPYLLGLSATTERVDGKEHDLHALVGPEVYRKLPVELSRDGHIAQFMEKRLFVDLSSQERLRYESLIAEYRWYMARRRGHAAPGAAAFQDLIRRAAVDPAARGALQAHHEARLIALNAGAKIGLVGNLLAHHRLDKVIVFSEFNAIVDTLSRHLLLPSITYKTPARERRQVLDRFRSGQYSKLITGRVLNEGVDVPDANVAIVVSGSAATREYIQRLGRILRPKASQAILYELITRHTSEGRSAARRRPREEHVA